MGEDPDVLEPTYDLSRVSFDDPDPNIKLYTFFSEEEYDRACDYLKAFKQQHFNQTKTQFKWVEQTIIAVVLGDVYVKPYGKSAKDEFEHVPLHLALVGDVPKVNVARFGCDRPVGSVRLLDGQSGEMYGLVLQLEEARWVHLSNLRKHDAWQTMSVRPTERALRTGDGHTRKLSFGGPMLSRNLVQEHEHGGNLFVCAKSTLTNGPRTSDPWLSSVWQFRVGQIFRLDGDDLCQAGETHTSNEDGLEFLESACANGGDGVLVGLRRLDYTENGEKYEVLMMYVALRYAPSHPLNKWYPTLKTLYTCRGMIPWFRCTYIQPLVKPDDIDYFELRKQFDKDFDNVQRCVVMEVPFRRVLFTNDYQYYWDQAPVLEALGIILRERSHEAPSSLDLALNYATLLRPFGEGRKFRTPNGPVIRWRPEFYATRGIGGKVRL